MEEEMVRQIAIVKETRKRLKLADTILEYFRKDDSTNNCIKDFGCLIGGLANWIRSPSLQVRFIISKQTVKELHFISLQVSMTAMKILALIVTRKRKHFFCYINTSMTHNLKTLSFIPQ